MALWPAEIRTPSRANVLGVGIHAVDMNAAVAIVSAAVSRRVKGYVCAAGVHGVMEAQREAIVREIFANALLVVPDGMPTVWMGRMQGLRSMNRVFGPDLMLAVAGQANPRNCSHFLCGGNYGVAEELRDSLKRQFPDINVVGTYTPPFRHMTKDEESDFIHIVDRSHPDILWVGMSTPKQERFMAEYLPRLNTTLMIGVGAAFDFHTGRLRDSPAWVKRSGLQWLHRLLQEPRRLWKRYLINNPQFLFKAGLQLAGRRRYTLEASTRASHPASLSRQIL